MQVRCLVKTRRISLLYHPALMWLLRRGLQDSLSVLIQGTVIVLTFP